MIPRPVFVLSVVLLLLASAQPGGAHRVNLFAYCEQGTIVAMASFSASKSVHQGVIEAVNAATGEVYFTGTTDDSGELSFPVPAAAVAEGADILLRLDASQGHAAEWTVPAREYLAEMGLAETAAGTKTESRDAPSGHEEPIPAPEHDELKAMVQEAVAQEVAPLRRMLAEREQGPGPTEIAGGIGYIVGLFGMAAWFVSRRKRP